MESQLGLNFTQMRLTIYYIFFGQYSFIEGGTIVRDGENYCCVLCEKRYKSCIVNLKY